MSLLAFTSGELFPATLFAPSARPESRSRHELRRPSVYRRAAAPEAAARNPAPHPIEEDLERWDGLS